MLRRRPSYPLSRRSPVRIPTACRDVLGGTPAAGKLTGPGGADTKLCEECYVHLERNGAHLLGDGVALTREI